jgi:lipid A 4'-phosphatase
VNILFQKYAPLLPLAAFVLITPFTPQFDLELSQAFYTPAKGFESNSIYQFFYQYGFYPADAVGIGALIVFLASFWMPAWKRLAAPALALFLTLAIGSGLIVHLLLKDQWGRPRPKQIEQFGGILQFRPYYSPNLYQQKMPAKSFPCGHCSTGFYFFCLACIGWKENSRVLLWMGLCLAFGLGVLLSLTRIAQGGHFFSDTAAAALIMWLTSYYCTRFAYHRLRAQ